MLDCEKYMKKILSIILGVCTLALSKEPLVKISEILIDCQYLEEYKNILQTESKQSVKLENGVLMLYAMQHENNPCQFSIIEAYKDQQSYENHIKSPHFQLYKQSTLHMIRDLKFIPMKALNPQMALEKNIDE